MSDREYLVDGRCNDSNSVAIFIAFRGESLDTMFAQCSAFGAGMLQFLRIWSKDNAKAQLRVSRGTEHCEMLRATT